MKVQKFIFNPIHENTYVAYDATKECVIIDPGCHEPEEKKILRQFIADNGLKPKALLNTHCHFDHIFGNDFVRAEYGIELWASENEMANIRRFKTNSSLFGYSGKQPDFPSHFLD
ncbi:MAG: MBL fold metallo-hydrolase, partial [Prevotellaceae bacterium]|nr:MBL fold metallo-hydrolase [Prevotellaceae bacterium]